MNTRSYRTARTIANLEASFDGDRQRLAQAALIAAQAERTAQGVAAIEPAQLAAMFAECPWRAWGLLAGLTERQLVIEAIDYAMYLETQGIEKRWGAILGCWTRKLAERAAEAESLLALAEQGAFDDDGGHEDEGREPEADARAVISVESQTRPGVVYQVAEDGSRCTCPGYRYHGHCKHATAQAEAYTAAHEAVYGPSRPDGTPGYGGWGHAA
jgi:hypothetical protein